jgi:hypothetical protein
VRKFSGKLNAYVTVCNKVNDAQYKGFTDWQYGLTSWNGAVVRIDIDALLVLYDYAITDDFRARRNLFLLELAALMQRPGDDAAVHITAASATAMVDRVKSGSIPVLDTAGLKKHFELNTIS